MKNNKGFTLVELIVVIAIIGVLAGAMSYSLNYITRTRVTKFTGNLNTMISQCRVETLSGAAFPTYMELKYDNGNYKCTLYEGSTVKDSIELGGRDVECSFVSDDKPYEINESMSLYLAFNRSTGAFLALDEVKGSSNVKLNGDISGNCEKIVIRDTGITLIPETGYHRIGI